MVLEDVNSAGFTLLVHVRLKLEGKSQPPQSFVTMVVRSSSISFPPGHTHTHTESWICHLVNRDIIMLRQKCLLKQFWTDSEFWSVRYANPATSRVPKKPPITQPMSMEKLVPLSACESQHRSLNRSSSVFFIYHQYQLKQWWKSLFFLSLYREHAGRQKMLLYFLTPDRWLLCHYQRKRFLWGSTSPLALHFSHRSYHKAPETKNKVTNIYIFFNIFEKMKPLSRVRQLTWGTSSTLPWGQVRL